MSGTDSEEIDRVGWFVPDAECDEYGRVLAAIEEAGFKWSEMPPGEIFSRRRFKIKLPEDDDA